MRHSRRLITLAAAWNARPHHRCVAPLLGAVVFAAMWWRCLFPLLEDGELGLPPRTGDGPDYDMIAFQIARGRGVSVDWDNAEFRAPYEQHNQHGAYDRLLLRTGTYPTAYRPPLLPMLMAAVYRTAGRRFGLVRMAVTACCAAACSLATLLAYRLWGPLPAAVTAAVLLFGDSRLRRYSQLILTEAPATLAAIVITWLLVAVMTRPRAERAAALGAALGLATLTRSAFLLWGPWVVLAVVLAPLLSTGTAPRRYRTSAILTACCVGAFLTMTAPWMVRNCNVTGTLAPLGTQGGTGLPGGYSDAALRNHGIYSRPERARDTSLPPPGRDKGIEREVWNHRQGMRLALGWIHSHPLQVPRLMTMKTVAMWRTDDAERALFFAAAALGACLLLAHAPRQGLCLVLPVVAATATTALTWAADGRFAIPLYPQLALLAAAAVWILAQRWVWPRERVKTNLQQGAAGTAAPNGTEPEERSFPEETGNADSNPNPDVPAAPAGD